MRITYFAEDGTELHSKEACEAYERRTVMLPKNVIAFDYDNKILPYSCDNDFFNKVKFLYFKNKEAVEAFHNEMGRIKWINEKTDRYDYYFHEETLYYYDTSRHAFVEVEESIEYHKEKIKDLNAGKMLIKKALKT